MSRSLLCASAVLLGLCLVDAASAARRALLIGINDYEYGGETWDLRGCVNDVHMTRQLLLDHFGFQPGDIKVLIDEQATARAIVAAIEDWLIAGTGPEDVAYLHFSGHGSQVPDADGDEDDGFDELLCPADLQPTDAATMILDDELKGLIDRIPAASLTTVLDACHSGTGTRDFSLSRPRYLPIGKAAPRASGTRGLAPADPSSVVSSFFAVPDQAAPASMEAAPSGARSRVTISGCKADQTSADAWIRDDFYAGALTSNLVANARRAPAGTTYGELLELVRRDMAGKYYQTPQVEGDTQAWLLSAATTGPPSTGAPTTAISPTVTAVSRDRVRISAGWASGVTPGSVFEIFATTETPGSVAAAELQVDRVEQSWSEGPLPPGVQVAIGDRAERRSHGVALEALGVRLDGDTDLAEDLRQALAAIDFVRVADPQAHFDLRLSAQRQAGLVVGTLVFDGVPRSREEAATVSELVERLRPHLANAYVIARLTALQNPAASFRLSLWGQSGASDGKVVHARIGDEIVLRFTAERDCYVTLLNVGTSGKISVLFPNQFQPDAWVQAGQTYRTGEPGAMPFRIRAAGPPGRELVKAIATMEPLDVDGLLSPPPASGARGISPEQHAADQLTRDVAAVYVTAPAGDDPGPSQQIPLPTKGWSADHVIVETTR